MYTCIYVIYIYVFILFFWTENWFGLDCQPLFPAEECQHFLHGTYWQHLNIQLFWIQEGSPRGVVCLEKSHPFCGSFPDVSSWVVSVILCFGEIVNLVNKYFEITTPYSPLATFPHTQLPRLCLRVRKKRVSLSSASQSGPTAFAPYLQIGEAPHFRSLPLKIRHWTKLGGKRF